MSDVKKETAKISREIATLIPRYLDNRRKDIATLKGFMEARDFEAIGTIAHKIQGSSGCYGFDGLCRIACDLKRSVGDRDWDGIARHVRAMADYLNVIDVEYV